MRRFYSQIPGDHDQIIELAAEVQHHLTKVLRQPAGSLFELFDGHGRIARCRLAEDNRQAKIEELFCFAPPSVEIELIQGLAKGEKLDLVLQKGCELGVNRFILSSTERSILKIVANKEASRMQRWQKITQEACRQCGQPFVPGIDYSNSLPEALDFAEGELRLMLWEEASLPLKELLPESPPRRISLLVGPEGGFSAKEAGLAQAAGFQAVRLGPRILRTETAGLAILSILQYLYGDLDRNVSSFSSSEIGKDMS